MVSHRWARPEWHRTIDSTNLAVVADPRPGRVVVADHQSAGQGRRGRVWMAPPGTSLAVSVAVRAPSAELIGWVPLLTGVAVQRALAEQAVPLTTQLKWPNDVLVAPGGSGRAGKVCGVLASAQHGMVVIGAGLNIDQGDDELPVASATSWRLARGGSPLPTQVRQTWLNSYLAHLAALLDTLSEDSHAVRSAYIALCSTIGEDVVIDLPVGRAHGRASDIDPHGGLVLQRGSRRSVHHAGDVVHLLPGAGSG
ncbi:MAG: biotin--[acetyl-CoA-carboxylase] ligase [Ornithinimicrobium sp.]